MKKSFLGVLAITIISCNNSEPIDYTLFSGTIKNANSKSLTITNSLNKKVREIEVSDIGQFSDTIFNANGYFSFSDGKESSTMYLKNGYNLQLDMDAKEFDQTIVYTGNGSDENNYLAQKSLIEKKKYEAFEDIYSLEEEAFLEKIEELKNSIEKLLKDIENNAFVERQKIEINYSYIDDIHWYEETHIDYTKKKDFKVSKSFPDVLKGFDFDNEQHFKMIPIYKRMVAKNFFDTTKEKTKNGEPYETVAIDIIKNLKSQAIKNHLVPFVADTPTEDQYKNMMALSTDENFKKRLTKRFKNFQKLAKGTISPVFVNYANNAGGTTSLTDFKGKYVYIDVWATWCVPCIAEAPYLEKIEKKYHTKNIEFISLSVDKAKDYGKWKQMVKDKQFGGIQLLADNDWNSKFVIEYQIKSIPHFILIDPSGKIVNANAPKPSNKKLIELFDGLKI